MEAPGAVTIDDDFAKTLGLESLAKLKDAIKERVQREHAGASRQKLKRALLDQLDELHKFEPPPSLVEQEFNSVWSQIEKDLKEQGRTFADEDTTEEKAREEYRAIAERRVRLGLVIAEIGERNNIKVTDEQLRAAVMEQVRQFPGQERQIWEYYQKNPGALADLRAPLFEDKVVDFLVELAEVTEQAGFTGRVVQGRRGVGVSALFPAGCASCRRNFRTYLPQLHSRLRGRARSISGFDKPHRLKPHYASTLSR